MPEADLSTIPVSARFSPIYQQVGQTDPEGWRFVAYEVNDQSPEVWEKAFANSLAAADLLLNRIADQVLFEQTLPTGLSLFLTKYLRGDIRKPEPQRTKPSNIERDTLLSATAKRVTQRTGISLGFSKASFDRKGATPIRGCTIAAAALHAFDIHVSPTRAVDIVFKDNFLVERLEDAGFANRPIARALFAKKYGGGFKSLADYEAHYRNLALKAASYFAL